MEVLSCFFSIVGSFFLLQCVILLRDVDDRKFENFVIKTTNQTIHRTEMPSFITNFKNTCQVAFLTRMLYFILDSTLYLLKIVLTNIFFDVTNDSIYGVNHDVTCSFAGIFSMSRDYIRLFVWFILFLSFLFYSYKNKRVYYPILFVLLFSIVYKLCSSSLFFDPINKNCSLILSKSTNTNMGVNLLVILSSLLTLSFYL
jgi:hypothetical protein